MELINEFATAYAERHSSTEPLLLKNIAADTVIQHPQHHMLSGHLQGRFLSMISKIIQPGFILEIGSFTGYSALCLAEGLASGGQLHTIELRSREVAIARENFDKSPMSGQLTIHEGEAATIIPNLPFIWDLVFIDADKTGYIQYYELIIPRLRKGGLIIADNVLFHGEVLNQPLKGKNAKAIHEFNEYVKNDERVEQVMVTLRDGLLLVQKK